MDLGFHPPVYQFKKKISVSSFVRPKLPCVDKTNIGFKGIGYEGVNHSGYIQVP
jgi:hypothetical protein